MLSKNRVKFVQSLHRKKGREENGLFIAEGRKICLELAKSDEEIVSVFGGQQFLDEFKLLRPNFSSELIPVSDGELTRISALQSPQEALMICKVKKHIADFKSAAFKLCLFLDGMRDPGNIGTLLRTCDWFGIDHVFVSADCVETLNPKVIQASMGSFLRVKVVEAEARTLIEGFKSVNSSFSVYGAFMNGESVYANEEFGPGLLIVGNEANGIRSELISLIEKKISIPCFNPCGPESLNASIAAALMIAEYRRKTAEKIH